ncbi:MAG: small multi-drug export protein, partial [Spirochaetales bacterium]|nr:small multi-drug export protein [Spirochaetales bacterium]
YQRFFDRVIERARRQVHHKIARFGLPGLMIFVAIPLPITGAVTGTLGAWILGLERRKVFLAIAAGVAIAGVIVATVYTLGIKALDLFLK